MNIIKMILIFCFLILQFLTADEIKAQENFSSTRTDQVIRVGIKDNNFKRISYKQISLTSKGRLKVFDKFLNHRIVQTYPNDTVKFYIEGTTFKVYKNSEKIADCAVGPIFVEPVDNYPVEVVGLKRKGKQAAYRGRMEVMRFPGKKDIFSLVNVLPLEDYLKGVVPNELPPSFGFEALKAQSVAARNYAIRPRVKLYPHFDVCDSVQSQVYFGVNTEAPVANEAIEATKGLVALYDGEVILALYSSTGGGHTESYENAFSEPCGGSFPAKPLPYLKGVPDVKKIPDLTKEKNARKFYTTTPKTFDNKSGYYRWNRSWSGEELRQVLNNTLKNYPDTDLISPEYKEGQDIGRIKRVDVLSRGVSGKAIAIQVSTSKGAWVIKKELIIRRVFKKDGRALPSANIVLNNHTDKEGYLVKLEAYGGGFGHGVGMSQYGASYMSNNGYTFDQILQHYYTGTTLGTWPVYMASEYITPPIKQMFSSPNGEADLILENEELIENFNFVINSNKLSLTKEQLNREKIRISLDEYIKEGINEIIFYPLNEEEEKSVKAWIEVFSTRNN